MRNLKVCICELSSFYKDIKNLQTKDNVYINVDNKKNIKIKKQIISKWILKYGFTILLVTK